MLFTNTTGGCIINGKITTTGCGVFVGEKNAIKKAEAAAKRK
jgi:hypothetical protein